MNRDEAIARIREELLRLSDEDNCICKVAAERGIFCRGFRRFNDAELRERYDWIVRKKPGITRDELERLANAWQLTQQEVRDAALACDVQTVLHDTCRGFDDFSDEQIASYYRQLTGESISIG